MVGKSSKQAEDRDVFGVNWDDWTWRTAQMDLQGNRLAQPDPHQHSQPHSHTPSHQYCHPYTHPNADAHQDAIDAMACRRT